MTTRSTIEVNPDYLKVIKTIAERSGAKQKFVTDRLLNYALFHVKEIFPDHPYKPQEISK